MKKLKTVLLNYDHPETHKNKDKFYVYSFNYEIKGLKEDFELTEHLRRDFVRSIFDGFANEECFLLGIAVGRGFLTIEDDTEEDKDDEEMERSKMK